MSYVPGAAEHMCGVNQLWREGRNDMQVDQSPARQAQQRTSKARHDLGVSEIQRSKPSHEAIFRRVRGLVRIARRQHHRSVGITTHIHERLRNLLGTSQRRRVVRNYMNNGCVGRANISHLEFFR
jgi:hypothetical protein